MKEQRYIVLMQTRSGRGLSDEYVICSEKDLKNYYPHYTIYPIGERLTDKDKEKLGMNIRK
jgi:hypothetical protein